jgi:acyl-CoA synthetase (AMP-forming)/AMP-acid ligase II
MVRYYFLIVKERSIESWRLENWMNEQARSTMNWIQEQRSRFEREAPESMGELLSQSAQKYGEQIAVDFFDQGKKLSYRELDRQVSQLANGLRKIGVKYKSHVAVILPNRIEVAVTWLTLARMGAVMVPVNPAYTPYELEFTLNDAEVDFVVLEASGLKKLDAMEKYPKSLTKDNLVFVGEAPGDCGCSWKELMQDGSVEFTPDTQIRRSDLLNIQYTSGTTGFPKGCMQTQGFWLTCGYNVAYWKGFPPVKSILGEAPFFYFDALWMFAGMLVKGGVLYQAERYSSSRFWDRLRITQAELAYLPISFDDPHPGEKEHNVKMFMGFGLNPALVKEVEMRFGATAREGYGMTEIGICLMTPMSITDESAFGTCGIPLPFYELRIVDSDGNDVPQGQKGELWVRCNDIINGYWNRPETNTECFVDGWFRTGDIFVKEQGGYYRIVGRIKEMIKRSGENISAHEVELVIRQFDGVEDVAVIPVPDDYRGEEVKAIIKLRDDFDKSQFDPAELRAHCEKHLAAFKCPRFIRLMDEFPLLGSGKIDKAQLTAPEDLRTDSWDNTIGDWIQ